MLAMKSIVHRIGLSIPNDLGHHKTSHQEFNQVQKAQAQGYNLVSDGPY